MRSSKIEKLNFRVLLTGPVFSGFCRTRFLRVRSRSHRECSSPGKPAQAWVESVVWPRRREAVEGGYWAKLRPVRSRELPTPDRDRKSTRLNSSHGYISYA